MALITRFLLIDFWYFANRTLLQDQGPDGSRGALFAAINAPLTDLTNPEDASHTRWKYMILHMKILFPQTQGPS